MAARNYRDYPTPSDTSDLLKPDHAFLPVLRALPFRCLDHLDLQLNAQRLDLVASDAEPENRSAAANVLPDDFGTHAMRNHGLARKQSVSNVVELECVMPHSRRRWNAV